MEINNNDKSYRTYKLFDFVKIPFIACPIYTFSICCIRFISALLPPLMALITAYFVNTIISIFNEGTKFDSIIYPLLCYIGITSFTFFNEVLLRSFINIKFDLKIQMYFRTLLIEKRAKIQYKFVENNETWELVNRTGNNVTSSIISGFNAILDIIELIAQIIMTLSIIFIQVWWASLIISAISFGFIQLALRSGKAIYESDKNAEINRRRVYVVL